MFSLTEPNKIPSPCRVEGLWHFGSKIRETVATIHFQSDGKTIVTPAPRGSEGSIVARALEAARA